MLEPHQIRKLPCPACLYLLCARFFHLLSRHQPDTNDHTQTRETETKYSVGLSRDRSLYRDLVISAGWYGGQKTYDFPCRGVNSSVACTVRGFPFIPGGVFFLWKLRSFIPNFAVGCSFFACHVCLLLPASSVASTLPTGEPTFAEWPFPDHPHATALGTRAVSESCGSILTVLERP